MTTHNCYICKEILRANRPTGRKAYNPLTEKYVYEIESVTDYNPDTDDPQFIFLPGIVHNDQPVAVCYRCNSRIKRKKISTKAKRPTRKESKAWQKLLTNKVEHNPSSQQTSTVSLPKSSNS